MKFLEAYTRFFQRFFPSPFTIAILLSAVTLIGVLIFLGGNPLTNLPEVATYWFDGMFTSGLLSFTFFMMYILVMGHILALSKPAQKVIDLALIYCTNTASAAFVVTLLTIVVALFNWGLGLIFGAILARKIGEHFQRQNIPLNYPLIGAAAYVGLMVWHGGFSGSAPLTVAGAGHSLENAIGVLPITETLLSPMNLIVTLLLLVVLPVAMYFVGKRSLGDTIPVILEPFNEGMVEKNAEVTPAEKLENNHWFGRILGVGCLLLFGYLAWGKVEAGQSALYILNLQTTSLLLMGFALLAHGSFSNFLSALEISIKDVSGILIQFPIYFGIMGMMQSSGLVTAMASYTASFAGETLLPVMTFISSGLVNIFIPSGGGQWQVQGPLIAHTASATGISIGKLVMSFSYGDQLTNMLQPFWALPLLGITGLKAKDILPYTLMLFALGFTIFVSMILIF